MEQLVAPLLFPLLRGLLLVLLIVVFAVAGRRDGIHGEGELHHMVAVVVASPLGPFLFPGLLVELAWLLYVAVTVVTLAFLCGLPGQVPLKKRFFQAVVYSQSFGGDGLLPL